MLVYQRVFPSIFPIISWPFPGHPGHPTRWPRDHGMIPGAWSSCLLHCLRLLHGAWQLPRGGVRRSEGTFGTLNLQSEHWSHKVKYSFGRLNFPWYCNNKGFERRASKVNIKALVREHFSKGGENLDEVANSLPDLHPCHTLWKPTDIVELIKK